MAARPGLQEKYPWVYKATWNRFLSYSASPIYSRKTAEQFLCQYFGVDVHAILHQAMEDAVHAHVIARNPTIGATVPKVCHAPKRVLTDEELDTFLEVVQADEVRGDFFYVERANKLGL